MNRKKVFGRPASLKPVPFRFCPGCGHSIAHRLIAECVDELGIRERTIGIAPVGCAVFAYDYFDFDMIEVAHGRPPAVATGMKRMIDVLGERTRICCTWGVEGFDVAVSPPQKPMVYAIRGGVKPCDLAF